MWRQSTNVGRVVFGFTSGGTLIAAVITGQAMDIQPAAERVSNMGWNVKTDAVGEPCGKDLSR